MSQNVPTMTGIIGYYNNKYTIICDNTTLMHNITTYNITNFVSNINKCELKLLYNEETNKSICITYNHDENKATLIIQIGEYLKNRPKKGLIPFAVIIKKSFKTITNINIGLNKCFNLLKQQVLFINNFDKINHISQKSKLNIQIITNVQLMIKETQIFTIIDDKANSDIYYTNFSIALAQKVLLVHFGKQQLSNYASISITFHHNNQTIEVHLSHPKNIKMLCFVFKTVKQKLNHKFLQHGWDILQQRITNLITSSQTYS